MCPLNYECPLPTVVLVQRSPAIHLNTVVYVAQGWAPFHLSITYSTSWLQLQFYISRWFRMNNGTFEFICTYFCGLRNFEMNLMWGNPILVLPCSWSDMQHKLHVCVYHRFCQWISIVYHIKRKNIIHSNLSNNNFLYGLS